MFGEYVAETDFDENFRGLSKKDVEVLHGNVETDIDRK